jgi:hypothetical protein
MLTLQIKATTSPHGCIQLFQPRSEDNHNLFGKVPLTPAFPFSGVSSAGGSQRVLEFLRLCRLYRYPGAAVEL